MLGSGSHRLFTHKAVKSDFFSLLLCASVEEVKDCREGGCSDKDTEEVIESRGCHHRDITELGVLVSPGRGGAALLEMTQTCVSETRNHSQGNNS